MLGLVIGLYVSGGEDEEPDGESEDEDQVERYSFHGEESSWRRRRRRRARWASVFHHFSEEEEDRSTTVSFTPNIKLLARSKPVRWLYYRKFEIDCVRLTSYRLFIIITVTFLGTVNERGTFPSAHRFCYHIYCNFGISNSIVYRWWSYRYSCLKRTVFDRLLKHMEISDWVLGWNRLKRSKQKLWFKLKKKPQIFMATYLF